MSPFHLSISRKKKTNRLPEAITNDDRTSILKIVEKTPTIVNQRIDEKGNTALLLALRNASLATICLLLDNGADADQENFVDGQTPLTFLVLNETFDVERNLEIAQLLIDHGAYVNKTTSFVSSTGHDLINETPLMTSIRIGNIAMVNLFAQQKSAINHVDEQTRIRPFDSSLLNKQNRLSIFLFRHFRIHYAVVYGNYKIFDLLENAGASCRSVLAADGNTLLHWFCLYSENDKKMSLLKRILRQRCDLNCLNADRRTPIMLAAKHDMFNTCSVLLKENVRLDQVDCYGHSAVDLAEPDSPCKNILIEAVETREKNIKTLNLSARNRFQNFSIELEQQSERSSSKTQHVKQKSNKFKQIIDEIIERS